MATYRIHTYLSTHEGQKTGQVRSCTPGARVTAPPGEFSDLVPGRDYNRVDTEGQEPADPDDPTPTNS
jgi:hypothetical protein